MRSITLGRATFRSHRIVLEDFALEHPDLDAADAVSRVRFGRATAKTAMGTCGVKVWIFKGEILEHDPMASERRATEGDHAHSGGGRRRENA